MSAGCRLTAGHGVGLATVLGERSSVLYPLSLVVCLSCWVGSSLRHNTCLVHISVCSIDKWFESLLQKQQALG